MFLSKPSFSEHDELLFFRGERFTREFVAKLVYVLSARELMSCSVVQKRQKERSVGNANSECTKKKNSVSLENSFYFLSSENK